MSCLQPYPVTQIRKLPTFWHLINNITSVTRTDLIDGNVVTTYIIRIRVHASIVVLTKLRNQSIDKAYLFWLNDSRITENLKHTGTLMVEAPSILSLRRSVDLFFFEIIFRVLDPDQRRSEILFEAVPKIAANWTIRVSQCRTSLEQSQACRRENDQYPSGMLACTKNKRTISISDPWGRMAEPLDTGVNTVAVVTSTHLRWS